jgi:hypothetical protein
MWLKKNNLWFLAFAVGLLGGCKNQNQSPNSLENNTLPTDFVKFYDTFHTDSLYQMAHIQFPLAGLPPNADSATIVDGGYLWQAQGWEMHRANFDAQSFTRTLKSPLDGIVEEYIRHNQSGVGIYRRFYKRGNDWTLIFYAASNQLN